MRQLNRNDFHDLSHAACQLARSLEKDSELQKDYFVLSNLCTDIVNDLDAEKSRGASFAQLQVELITHSITES